MTDQPPTATPVAATDAAPVDVGTEHAGTSDQHELSDAEARALARQAYLDSGGTLTGGELGDRFDRSERWGRNQITAVNEANGNHRPRNGTNNGSRPADAGTINSTSAATQPAQRHAAAGTPPAGRSGAGNRRQAARRKPGAVPWPLLAVTVVAVLVVTAVCAVVSYVHIRDLARLVGTGDLAAWQPLAVDGLVVACSCSLIVDHRLERPGYPLAWVGVALGLATTLVANVVAVDPGLVPIHVVRWVLAGYAPAALGVSGHLLFRMLGNEGDSK